MSRFNQTVKNRNVTRNKEGAKAYDLTSELKLYTVVCTTTLQNKFYENNKQTYDRLVDLLKNVDPEFACKLAVYAREKMYLRLIPVVMAVELARIYSGKSFISDLIERVIQRPDEITEMLAFYQYINNRTGTKKLNRLSNQIKKGIKKVFESGKFDEYQYSKYNRKTDIKLRDALFLSHPKPQDKAQKELFNKIADDNLDTAYTWETQMSEAGKKDSPLTTKKEVWEEMINSKKMGYMATLRNLRNFLEDGVSKECIEKVCDYLRNPVAVRNSKQLPFRFLAAYRMMGEQPYTGWDSVVNRRVESPYTEMVINALEDAVKESIYNIPMFDNENVLIATDVSGSMYSKVSSKSVINMFDIGTVLAMMMYSKCNTAVAGMFGNDWKVVSFPKSDILRNANEIYKREGEVGYSTNGYKVIEWANKKSKQYTFDKVMVFTDCQLYGGDIVKEWKKYKRINPNAKLYLFDLSGYGNTPLNVENNDVFLISGWSDKVFDVLKTFDEGEDAIDKIMEIDFDID
jgi:hypothetical protein